MSREPEVLIHATTGIPLSERFTLLHAERGPPGSAPTGGKAKKANFRSGSADNVQLLQALANDPAIQRQLKQLQNATQNKKTKNIKQRLGVKGRLGLTLQDRLGPAPVTRGGGMARIRGGIRGAGPSNYRGRGQFRGGGGRRGNFVGGGEYQGRGRGFSSRGAPRGRGAAVNTRGGRGGRGGASRGARGRGRGRGGGANGNDANKKVTKEELDSQLDAYMTTATDGDVVMS